MLGDKMYKELEHSGIKGQKWGHRNGPPYPLSASDHSASEKKAGTKGWTLKAKKENKVASNIVSTKKHKLPTGTITDGYQKHKKPGYVKEETRQKVSDMSDSELRKAIDRKRLEKRYKELKRGDGTVYDTIRRLTDTAGEIATTKRGKKSPEAKVIGKLRKLEDQSNAAISKTKDAKNNKNVSEMSDAELKKQTDRLQLEKDYKDLNPTKIQNGMKVAASLIEAGVAIYVIHDTLIKRGEQFVSKDLDNRGLFGKLTD